VVRLFVFSFASCQADHLVVEGDAEGGAAGDRSQLNVAVSGVNDDPIGFVQIEASTDLSQLRAIIRRDLAPAFESFRFLSNGVPVSVTQENRLMATDFMPLIVIQPSGTLSFSFIISKV